MLPKWYRYSSREITSFWLCSTYGQKLLMLISYCSYYKYHTFTNIQTCPDTQRLNESIKHNSLLCSCGIVRLWTQRCQEGRSSWMESVQRGVSVLWLRSSGGPRDVVDVNISPASALKTVPAVPIAPADTHTPQSHICSIYVMSYDHITTVCVSWERRSCCSCTTGWEMWPKPHLWNIRCMV